MKIERYKMPKSSFLSVDKDIASICEMLMENDRICRLLYRTNNNPMQESNLTEEEKIKLFTDKYIRTVPRISVDSQVLNYVIISFENFLPNRRNNEFRDNDILIDIVCHFDQWTLADGQIRPFRLAGEIDSILNGAKLSGIGTLEFKGADQMIYSGEFGGITLLYRAVHGDDDKQNFENPVEQELFLKEFETKVDG